MFEQVDQQPDILSQARMLNALMRKCVANSTVDTFPKIDDLVRKFNLRDDILIARIEGAVLDLKHMTEIVKEVADIVEVVA